MLFKSIIIPCELYTSISPYLISEGYQIFRSCDPHSIKTMTLNKYVAEYEYMGKWMVEFLNKFKGRSIKFARVNSICIAKTLNYFNILSAIPL